MNKDSKKEVETVKDVSFISGVSRFLGLIIIFWAIALIVVEYNTVIPVLMFIISFLLFSISNLSDRLNDLEYEIFRVKKKVKKAKVKKKSSSK